ncbi:MAG: ATP-binding protein [Spirochaetia bacterium]
MTAAIASGKGGTGKTTVAVNLALCLSGPVQLLDCDVEEPNCAIFLKPSLVSRESVGLPVPRVDETLCTACGECGRFCRYHAIVSFKTTPLVFPELCHGCGGCTLVCPTGAISEEPRAIGTIEGGTASGIDFLQGRLNVGEAMPVPLIRALKKKVRREGIVILDCPPGTSCPVISAMRGSDFIVLVTEPTPFGLHDLILAVETARAMALPFGVVINRADIGDQEVHRYCDEENIPILLEIPDERRIAEAYSRGFPAVEALPGMRDLFEGLGARIVEEAEAHRAAAKPTGSPLNA